MLAGLSVAEIHRVHATARDEIHLRPAQGAEYPLECKLVGLEGQGRNVLQEETLRQFRVDVLQDVDEDISVPLLVAAALPFAL